MADEKLAEKGSRYPTKTVMSEGARLVALTRSNAAPLEANGWTVKEDTAQLEDKLEELGEETGTLTTKRQGKTAATRAELTAREKALKFIHRVPLAVKQVRKKVKTEVTVKAVSASKKAKESTPEMVLHLNNLQKVLKPLDGALKGRFEGRNASELAATLQKALATADAVQENARKTQHGDTEEVNALKGEIVELFDALWNAAQLAYEDDEAALKPFKAKLGNAHAKKKNDGDTK